MKIAIDQNIPGIGQTFAHNGDVLLVEGRALKAAQLGDVRALIVRSVTPVNAALLENTPVEFVGSATIGTDHLDIPWLESQGISWVSAPGCNADAAAQYSLAMMLSACQHGGRDLLNSRVGVVGHGNVGSRLVHLLQALGVTAISVCDPPLADAGQLGLCTWDEITACEVISFHVPLGSAGKYPTHHMINASFLAQLTEGTLLVNTSRGKIVSGTDLLHWLQSARGMAALDVFPNEPVIEPALLQACAIATPHVAGNSQDGKTKGTLAIYAAFCKWLGLELQVPDLLGALPRFTLNPTQASSVTNAVLAACPVQRDVQQLRPIGLLTPDQQPPFFDGLRKNYPLRRDFTGWNVPAGLPRERMDKLKSLGFH